MITAKDVHKLASFGCTVAEICAGNQIVIADFESNEELLNAWHSGHFAYIVAIRKSQLNSAYKLQQQTLVHLGKTELNQREQVTQKDAEALEEIKINIISDRGTLDI